MIRKVVYFSMKVPNRPGIGMQMLKSIAMGKENLHAFTGFPQGGKAQVDFVPANPVEFAKGAKNNGVNLGKRKTAYLVQGDDDVTSLLRVINKPGTWKVCIVEIDAASSSNRG